MNKLAPGAIVLGLFAIVGAVIALKNEAPISREEDGSPAGRSRGAATPSEGPPSESAGVPRLLDLGADKCIPCKLMAPILQDLKKEYAGRLEVAFIDVWKNPDAGEQYGVKIIPTQIFYDATGKERFRHEGFFSKEDILAKWEALGVRLKSDAPAFSRLEPLQVDARSAREVCYMCDGDIAPSTRVAVKSDAGDVFLCSPHCYFILYTSLLEKDGLAERTTVSDRSTGEEIAAQTAVYLYGQEEQSGRPTVAAFADRGAALKERHAIGGSLISWERLQSKELASRCGFCDRAVYPEDAAPVRVAGVYTWGCCPMCALGVAARTGRDIEARVRDALTHEEIVVTTLDGSIASVEPSTAVAWTGARKNADGTLSSTGCFKQAFFTSRSNLEGWIEKHPPATGRQVTIAEALAKKMKMTPEQIAGACKIGECRAR